MPVIFTVKFHYLHFPPLLLLVPHPFTFKFHTTLKIILYLQIPVLANSKTTDLQPVLANSYNPFLSMFKKTCRRRHITVEGRLLFCFFVKCNLRLRQRLISHLVHLENATAARDSYTLLLSFINQSINNFISLNKADKQTDTNTPTYHTHEFITQTYT